MTHTNKHEVSKYLLAEVKPAHNKKNPKKPKANLNQQPQYTSKNCSHRCILLLLLLLFNEMIIVALSPKTARTLKKRKKK